MNSFEPTGQTLTNDRLLSIADVCKIMGCHPVTASKFMKESGHALILRRRVYILESNFLAYIQSKGVA